MSWIKICGITNSEDAAAACSLAINAVGFNFVGNSPRYIDPEKARAIIATLPSAILRVGVFVNEDPQRVEEIARTCGLSRLQFHGDESLEYCRGFAGRFWKVFHPTKIADLAKIDPYLALQKNDPIFLLDSRLPGKYGGTGITVDWNLAAQATIKGRLILSGGLHAGNVVDALARVKPYGVDVASGVEADPQGNPGRKDFEKMRAFVSEVRKHG